MAQPQTFAQGQGSGQRGTGSYSRDNRSKRDRLETRREELFRDRTSFESHWRDLGDFVKPRRTRFFVSDRNRGDKKHQNIIESTAATASRTLAAGLHAGLTSPARPWFKLTTPDPELAESGRVKNWLHIVTQRMRALLLQANTYQIFPTVYGDLGTFATGCMAMLPDDEDLFRCYQYPIGSYALGTDKRGIVSSFVRDYLMTVEQIVEEFGLQEDGKTIDWTGISPFVKNAWDRSEYLQTIEVSWIVTRNVDADREKLESKYLPWASCYFERGGDRDGFLKEAGFRTFPIFAPRWDVTGEDTYGTDCPGMLALGDVRGIQVKEKTKAKAIVKAVDPPMVGPAQLMTSKITLLPGDVTFVDETPGTQGFRAAHEIGLNIDHIRLDILDTRDRIREIYFVDLFLMLQQMDLRRGAQPPTAREIDERHEEKMIVLGPVLERTNTEMLNPMIDRLFDMMLDAGMVPEAPEELQGVKLDVEYTSILAQAQKVLGVAGQDRFLSSVGALQATFPEARHKVNVFQSIDNYADMLGVDPRIVRPTEEAEEIMAREREAQAQVEQAAAMREMTGAVADLGSTPMEGDTALNRIVGRIAPAA